MKSLVLCLDGEWIPISTGIKNFSDQIRYYIKPIEYRVYENNLWRVHWTKLPELVQLAKRYYSHVDWSSLPEELQVFIVSGKMPTEIQSPPTASEEDIYKTLYVTSDAPMEIIKYAYKILANIYHPDKGGDLTKMTAINLAYNQIKKIRSIE